MKNVLKLFSVQTVNTHKLALFFPFFPKSKITKATNICHIICVNILSRNETKHLLHKPRSSLEGLAAPAEWLYSKEMYNILLQ